MESDRLPDWLDQVYSTRDSEIDCHELQAWLPAYVDLEAGLDPEPDDERLALVRAHLGQCPDCADEYQALKSVVSLEAQGRLPTVEESLAEVDKAASLECA